MTRTAGTRQKGVWLVAREWIGRARFRIEGDQATGMEKAKKQTHGRGANEVGKVLTVTVPDLIDAGGDAEFREMISLMYAAVGRLTTMRRTLARSLGLTSAQFAVLMTLLRLDTRTGVKIRDIADDLY